MPREDRNPFEPRAPLAMPSNIEAEQALLGAILVDNRAFHQVREFLKAEHFFEPVHQRLFAHMAQRIEEGGLADPILVKTAFEHDPALREVDGANYIRQLALLADSVRIAAPYGREIKRLWKRREMIAQAQQAIEDVGAEDYAGNPEVLRRARMAIDDLLAGDGDDIKTMAELADEIMREAMEGDPPVSTGFPDLDALMGGGLYAGRLYVFNAMSKHFKSGVMLSIMANAAMAGVPCGWLAAELSRTEVGRRLIATVGKFSPDGFKHPDDDVLRETIEAVRKVPQVTIVECPSIPFPELQAKAERLVKEKGVKVLFFDYWQRCRGEAKGERESHLAKVAEWMLSFAEEEQIAFVTASQINKRNGQIYYGDGLLRAASWQYTVHKGDVAMIDPTIPGGAMDPIWLTPDVDRHGKARALGSKEQPAFYIHPNGPRLVQAVQLWQAAA